MANKHFTILKRNRKVSINRCSGCQNLNELVSDKETSVIGLLIKLKKPCLVNLFKIVPSNGNIEWNIANNLDHTITYLL